MISTEIPLSTKLEDHIDDPIKKSVVGLALMGFKPIMSCCGFTYKNETVPKKHLLEKPYIYILYADLNENKKSLLLDIAFKSRWNISFAGYFIDFHAFGFKQEHPWHENCPHKYEASLLAINALEKVITEELKNFFGSIEIVIEDGNKYYKETLQIKHWQYEPCESWFVNKEIFDKL